MSTRRPPENLHPSDSLRRHVGVIVRRWKLFALSTIACGVVYAFYFYLTPPTYVARAEIQYLSRTPMQEMTGFLEKLGAARTGTEDVLETQVKVLSSETVLTLTLNRLGIATDEMSAVEREDLIKKIRSGLTVSRDGKTNLMYLSLRSDDPNLPVRFVNTLIEVFRLHDMHQRRMSKETQRDYLLKEIERYEEKLKTMKTLRTKLSQLEAHQNDIRQLEQNRQEITKKVEVQIDRLKAERTNLAKRFKSTYPRFGEIDRQISWLDRVRTGKEDPPPRSIPATPHGPLVATLKGVIYDREFKGNPLPDSTVTVQPGGIQAVTDDRGVYELAVPAGPLTVTISRSGYEPRTISREARYGDMTWGSLALRPTTSPLSEVLTPAASAEISPQVPIEPAWNEWKLQRGTLDGQLRARRRDMEETLRELESQGIDPEKTDFLVREAQIDETIYGNFKTQLAQVDLGLSDISSNVTVLKEATTAQKTIRPQLQRDLPLVLASSLMLFLGLAFLLEAFSATSFSPEEIEKATGIGVLGTLPYTSPSPTILLRRPDLLDPGSRRSQALARDLCRMLKTNLDVALHGQLPSVILVTGSQPREGKTITSIALSQTYAEAGHRVLLINANLRHPSLDKLFGVERHPGMLEVLSGSVKLDDAVKHFPSLRFSYLPGHLNNGASAYPVRNWSTTIPDLLEEVASKFDVAFIDTPPLLRVSDTLELARIVNRVLLVYAAGRTPLPTLQQAVHLLERAKAQLIGIVLNYTQSARLPGGHSFTYPYPTRPYYSPTMPPAK